MKRLRRCVSRWRSWRCCVGRSPGPPAIVSSPGERVAGATGLAGVKSRIVATPTQSLSTW